MTSFVIPSGVLTSTDKASVAIRKRLVEEGQILCVIELPRGVFRPYTDILTAIVYWKKSGRTASVQMFRPMSDGFTLDDRREPDDHNQLLEIEEDVKRAVSGLGVTQIGMEVQLETLKDHSLNLLPAWFQADEEVSVTATSMTALLEQLSAQSLHVDSLVQSLKEGVQNEE